MKEIHFYEKYDFTNDEYIRKDYFYTKMYIDLGFEIIKTTQMCFLSTELFSLGYRIFVHDKNYIPYEIKLGKNDCTNRNITMEHNLFKLWESGEFIVQ